MAGDGLAPSIFRRLGRQGGAPTASILAQSIVAILLVLTGEFGNLLTYIGSALSLMAALTVAGVWIVSRSQKTNGPNIFRTPGLIYYPILPVYELRRKLYLQHNWREKHCKPIG